MDSLSTPPSEPPTPRPADSAHEVLRSSAGAAAKSVADSQVSNRRSQRPRWRLVLLVMAVVVGTTCLGGLGVGYFLYYKASEPNRGTPSVTVDQYLEAALNERDDQRSALFTCGHPDIQQLRDLLKDLTDRESRFSIKITPSWENFQVTTNGDNATVALDLRLSTTVNGLAQREVQRWEFGVVQDGGWRVCSAKRVG
jgi:hypothetical protein